MSVRTDRVRRMVRSPIVYTALATLAAFALSYAAQFRSLHIADDDSFYHFRHAALLVERGLFNTEFPWLTASVVNTYGADLW